MERMLELPDLKPNIKDTDAKDSVLPDGLLVAIERGS